MDLLGVWLGSGVRSRLRRDRIAVVPGAEQDRILARLRQFEADLGAGPAVGFDGAFGMVTELAAVAAEIRAAADPAARALAPRAGTGLRHALKDLCDLGLAVDPGVPDLGAAVHQVAAAVPLTVHVTVDVVPGTPVVAATAYAVVCEALGNVVGHAGARRAVVAVRGHGPTVQISVDDDGIGGARPVIGGGIVLLAARAATLGGLLHLDSPPGSGTHLSVELPSNA
ncbi:hypothetical protein [Dactylosporangium sp. NPDC005555]|uniref:hypothetical protein n=1 Tax=Dactylosporangium sp. NPDC005555 TaxID=3154889 RepID=UPI0033BAFB7E